MITFVTNAPATDFAAKTGLTYGTGALAYALNANDVTLTAANFASAVSVTKTAPANVAANEMGGR